MSDTALLKKSILILLKVIYWIVGLAYFGLPLSIGVYVLRNSSFAPQYEWLLITFVAVAFIRLIIEYIWRKNER